MLCEVCGESVDIRTAAQMFDLNVADFRYLATQTEDMLADINCRHVCRRTVDGFWEGQRSGYHAKLSL